MGARAMVWHLAVSVAAALAAATLVACSGDLGDDEALMWDPADESSAAPADGACAQPGPALVSDEGAFPARTGATLAYPAVLQYWRRQVGVGTPVQSSPLGLGRLMSPVLVVPDGCAPEAPAAAEESGQTVPMRV